MDVKSSPLVQSGTAMPETLLPPGRLASFEKRFVEAKERLQLRLTAPGNVDEAYGDYIYDALAAYLDELSVWAFEAGADHLQASDLRIRGTRFRTALLEQIAASRFTHPFANRVGYVNGWMAAIDGSCTWGLFLDNVKRLAEWQASRDGKPRSPIAALREQAGWSQDRLAEESHLKKQTIVTAENRPHHTRPATYGAIAKALSGGLKREVTIAELKR